MITEYRQAVIDRLKATIREAREVDKYGGVFSEEEVRRRIINAPAIYVSALGIRPNGEAIHTGESYDRVEMAAYVFAANFGQSDAETVGWELAAKIRLQLSGRHFLSGTGMATDVGVNNLWTGDLDKRGVSIMAVTWQVEMVLGYDWLSEDLDVGADDFKFPSTLSVNESSGGYS